MHGTLDAGFWAPSVAGPMIPPDPSAALELCRSVGPATHQTFNSCLKASYDSS